MKAIRLLAFVATALAASISPAHAQSNAPTPAPTVITAAPYTISQPGYYILGANLYYAGNGSSGDAIITIGASNVTLDFNGHYISGPNSTPNTFLFGVYANEEGNLNIINGTIAYCYEGIKLTGNGTTSSLNINQHVENMLISYCYGFGIYTPFVRNTDIINCRISFIGGSTIIANAWGIAALDASSGVRVNDNVITNVTAQSGGTAYGIQGTATTFSKGNDVSNCQDGINGGKYQQNMTAGCTTAFSGGTDVGLNN